MPFTLIKGNYRPLAGEPDGDSVRFAADDPALWARLEGRPVNVSSSGATAGTAQLRFEAIDATERGATAALALPARDNMLRLIGLDAQANPQPRGWILARMTDDQSRRPICFVFAGETPLADGADVFLDEPLLRQSVNWAQARQGFAYPLYYNTLFASLRTEITAAVTAARADGLGYWPADATLSGVRVRGRADLAAVPPIWPKLWRRLFSYFDGPTSLSGFIDYLEDRNERVDVLSIMEERGVQDLVAVAGDTVRMTEAPENLRVVGEAGRRPR